MKFCTNCTYLGADDEGRLICTHPASKIRTDLVTGVTTFKSANLMRSYDCGPEGNLWSQAGPIRRFLTSFLGISE